jgi:hypothetical protein
MARTGPPLRTDRNSHQALGVDTLSEPVVSTLERAGLALGCDPDRLTDAVAAAGLPPWGRHASGATVYRWPELVAVARDHLGIPVPATRPTLAEYRARELARKERQQAGNRKRTRRKRR